MFTPRPTPLVSHTHTHIGTTPSHTATPTALTYTIDTGTSRLFRPARSRARCLRLRDQLPGRPPSLEAVHHDGNVGVACLDRPPGGPVRRASKRARAVEDERRVLRRGQLLRDVVALVIREEHRARDDALSLPEVGAVGIEDRRLPFRRAEERDQIGDVEDLERLGSPAG